MKLNLNQRVSVILTEHGADIYNKHMTRYSNLDYIPVIEGYELKIQLWNLMNIFSSSLYLGAMHVPFEDNSMFIGDF